MKPLYNPNDMNNFSFFNYLKKGKQQAIRISLSMLLLLTFNFAWANTNSGNNTLKKISTPEVMGLDLALTISTPAPVACVGGDVEYTIQILNQGTVDVESFEITNYIPVGMSLASTGNAGWTVTGNLAKLTVSNPLTAGGFTTAFITLTVDANASGMTLQNAAEISAADDDTDPNNTPPTDDDSTFDDVFTNDVIGGDNIVDGTGGDEDDHDYADVPLVILNPMATINQAICNTGNGSISIDPATYVSYAWNDGGTGASRTGLFAGQYAVTVTDNFGCTAVLDSIELTNDCSLCVSSAGTTTAVADTVCMVGGSATISFTDDGNAVVPPGFVQVHFLTTGPEQTIQDFDSISNITDHFIVNTPGEYCITTKVFDIFHVPQEEIDSMQLGVTQLSFVASFLADYGGYLCGSLSSVSTCIVVEACSNPLNLTATTTEAICNFDNGAISIDPSTYTSYAWSDGGTGPNRTGLFAGQYAVTVTDMSGTTSVLDSIELYNDCSACPNFAGTVTAAADTICMTGNSAVINFTEDGNSIMPLGYIDVHFLTTGAEQTIQYFDTTNAFVVTAPGEYCITTKVFDVLHVPQEEIDSMQLGVSQLPFVESFLIQGGGYLCGSLSSVSTCVVVEACDLIDTVYFSLETDSVGTYCFDGLPSSFSNNTTTTLCDGSTSGTDGTFGSFTVQETGCIVYTSNSEPGNDVDTICMIVSDDLGNIDTTIFIPTVFCHTPPSILNVPCDPNTMTGDFCFNVPFANISNYFVTVDGVPVSNGFLACAGGGTSINLSEGTHLIVIQEITANCAESSYQVSVSCSPCGDILAMDTIQMTSANCALPTDVCIDISPANIFNYSILLNGSNYAGSLNSCNYSGINDGTTIQVMQGTHELIVTETATGCIDTMTIIVDCPGCPDLIPDNLVMQDYSCADPIEVCLNLPMADLGNYTITDNGSFYNGSILSCNGTDVAVELDTGLHEVILLNNVTSCSDTMLLMIECVPNVIIIDTTIMVMGGDTLCLDSTLVGDIADIDLTCGDTTLNATVDYFFDTLTNCIIFEGTAIGTDTICFRIFNTGGERTDVFIYINVVQSCADDFVTANSAALDLTDCNGQAELCVDIPLDEILNYTITDNGVAYANTFAGCDFDTSLAYTYFTIPGQGTAGDYTVDSWSVNGTVYSGGFSTIMDLVDSMNVWDATGTWVIDQTSLIISGGNPSSTYGSISVTQDMTNAFALLDLNVNLLPNGTVLLVNEGIHEIVFTDTATTCTDTIQVMVMCTPGNIVYDTITVGTMDTYCVDTTNLLGNIDTIYNDCPMSSGEYVLFDVIDSTFCLDYEGVDIGTDTACVVICDDLGACDTTTVIVTVIPLLSDSLLAVTETDTTMMGDDIVINVLGNDIFDPTLLDTFYVVTDPTFGDIVWNPDGTITYTPDDGYCNDDTPDEYTYTICYENVCDTTTSFVYVLCSDPSDFQIYNGFSPNNDGLNDVFFIQGVESYPNNVLCIFNRWGNQVFRQEGYANGWGGEWETSIVPSGTYFYVFDNGEGEVYSGYVQIHR